MMKSGNNFLPSFDKCGSFWAFGDNCLILHWSYSADREELDFYVASSSFSIIPSGARLANRILRQTFKYSTERDYLPQIFWSLAQYYICPKWSFACDTQSFYPSCEDADTRKIFQQEECLCVCPFSSVQLSLVFSIAVTCWGHIKGMSSFFRMRLPASSVFKELLKLLPCAWDSWEATLKRSPDFSGMWAVGIQVLYLSAGKLLCLDSNCSSKAQSAKFCNLYRRAGSSTFINKKKPRNIKHPGIRQTT